MLFLISVIGTLVSVLTTMGNMFHFGSVSHLETNGSCFLQVLPIEYYRKEAFIGSSIIVMTVSIFFILPVL
jgi:hypothetical protein